MSSNRPFATLRLAVFSAALLTGAFSAPSSAADPRADYESLRKIHDTYVPSDVERGSDAYFDWWLHRAHTLRERGLEFIAAHPTHPLRWDVLVLLQYSGELEITFRADGSRTAGLPAVAAALWSQEYLGRLEDLLASKDAGRAARQEALMQLIDYYCAEIRRATIDNPRNGLVPSLLEWVKEFHDLDPRSGRIAYLYIRVARMLNALDPVQCLPFLDEKEALHRGKSDADTDVRRQVENFRRLVRNQQQPAEELWAHLARIEPTFDSAPYRGKVVLIASLAVDWTLRTMELEELYGKYHDAGLEIIQIAYENRGREVVMVGNRRTTKAAPLLQRDKDAVRRFVTEKKWPWPVLWEVATMNNEFHRFWAQNSVPAFLIVGRDGRIAREIPGELRLGVRIARELGMMKP
jgi:hypothetical protein